jgi:flagellar assembly factor FliW
VPREPALRRELADSVAKNWPISPNGAIALLCVNHVVPFARRFGQSDAAMKISTTRFGSLTVEDSDLLTFVDGLIGMEDCRRWVLLADAQNPALGWLQSLDRPEVALGVVSPRRFVADYQVRVARREIQPLGLQDPNDAQILAIVSHSDGALALNLKAPLVIHVAERLGRQIVARDDHAVQHRLQTTSRRKIA